MILRYVIRPIQWPLQLYLCYFLQMQYGQLDVSFNHEGNNYSFVRVFQKVKMDGTNPTVAHLTVADRLDCPQLTITERYIAIPTDTIHGAVSIFHNCTASCQFQRGTSHTTMEREDVVSRNTLTFTHDKKNKNYFHNIYCI